MADTYGVLSEKHGRKKKSGITAQLRTIGRDVFSALPKLRPETRAVLNDLSREYTLVLLTAGNPILQRRKIRNLRLGHYFNLVVITPKKTAPLLRGILRELGARPENAMMVGNSVRSDIIPAAEAGITPVQVIARGWQYDRVKGYNAKHRKIRTLLQLPEIAINVFGPHNVK